MQDNSSTETDIPFAIAGLADPEVPGQTCPHRTRIQLDLLLLTLEALDLDASETLLKGLRELQLQTVIKNRIQLWKLRNTNPLRRFKQRHPLSLEEAKAMVALACFMARRQTGSVRQLLMAHEQLQLQDLSVEHHFQLSQYLERFRGHFRSRMNPNRTAIAAYQEDEQLNLLGIQMLAKVLFCTGTSGMQRLWLSLFDGEVV
jgi:hypothetical protein